jgi:hypothetical protein
VLVSINNCLQVFNCTVNNIIYFFHCYKAEGMATVVSLLMITDLINNATKL